MTIQPSEIADVDRAGALPHVALTLCPHADDVETPATGLKYDAPAWRDPTAVLNAVQELVPSVRAVDVLASLAGLCAPAFSDACWATIREGDVTTPITPAGSQPRPITAGGCSRLVEGVLVLDIEGEGCEGWPPFTAEMAWLWHDRDRPTRSDKVIARLLLDRASALIGTQRLAATVDAQRGEADNLRTALHSNREIGQAIGILMWSHKMTSQQGFERLRTVSQHTHRKLRDVAAEVCATGTLEPF